MKKHVRLFSETYTCFGGKAYMFFRIYAGYTKAATLSAHRSPSIAADTIPPA